MFLTTKTKLIAIRIAIVGMIFVMFITPFAITTAVGIFSESVVRALFSLMEFFVAIFFLNEFHRIQIIIKKDKDNEEKIEKIGSAIGKYFKKSSVGMKGIVLSGGTATRLFPLTMTTSKQLLPVYDKQMIFYPINTLVKAGIREILIIVSPEHSGQYLNLLSSIFENQGISLFFKVQKLPKGLAEAFIIGEYFIGEDNVTLILGDNIFENNIEDVIKNFKSGGHVFAKKVPDPERFGVVKFDENNNVTRIEEKPKEWLSDYAIPGLYIYDKSVVEIAKNTKPSDRGEIEITAVNNEYLKRGQLKVSKLDGEWLDAGTFDSLMEAGRIVKEKGISNNFDPLVLQAIKEFNFEMKQRNDAILKAHNKILSENIKS